MAITRKTKAAGKAKGKAQDQVQDQPEFKHIHKSLSSSVRDGEALLARKLNNESPVAHTPASGEAGPASAHASSTAEASLNIMSARDVRQVREGQLHQARRMEALLTEVKAIRGTTGQNKYVSVNLAEAKAGHSNRPRAPAINRASNAANISLQAEHFVLHVAQNIRNNANEIEDSRQHESLAGAVKGVQETANSVHETIRDAASEATLQETSRTVVNVETKVEDALSKMAAYHDDTQKGLLEIESKLVIILGLLQAQ